MNVVNHAVLIRRLLTEQAQRLPSLSASYVSIKYRDAVVKQIVGRQMRGYLKGLNKKGATIVYAKV